MEDESIRNSEGLKGEYNSFTKLKIIFILACVVVAVIAVGVSVTIGPREISFIEVYQTIWNHITGVTFPEGSKEWLDDFIIWEGRIPRIFYAAVAGAGLAVSGVVMQSVMKNPLADPYTTGVSSGACFGVAVALVMGFSLSGQIGNLGFVLNAFIFALIPVAVIIVLSPLSNSSPATLILAGVAMSYLFNALNTLLLVTTDSETLAGVYLWQVGSLTDITWSQFYIMLTIVISGIVIILLFSRKLNIMTLGDQEAKSLGLDANVMRIICLLIMSLIVASIVAFIGIVGFIGLIVPHIVRMIIGSDNRFVIPASISFGAAFLMIADIISRLVTVTAIPVGVVVSFIGAPVFLYLIVKQRKTIW